MRLEGRFCRPDRRFGDRPGLGVLQPGEIVLMHVGASKGGSTLDADALPGVIAELRARGYAFATVTEFI